MRVDTPSKQLNAYLPLGPLEISKTTILGISIVLFTHKSKLFKMVIYDKIMKLGQTPHLLGSQPLLVHEARSPHF